LAQYLTRITPLLLGLGLVCLFIEFKTPGFGVFGISGISLLGLVFFGQFVAGLSGHEPALFFLLGIALVAAELFFFPGVMMLAVSGAALMLGSLVWSMTDLWPSEPIPISGDMFVMPLVNVLSGVVLSVLLFIVVLRYLPKGGLWDRMVLNAAVAGQPMVARPLTGGGEASAVDLLGRTGIAATALFPSGQVDIGGRRYEARLAMGFAEAGTPVIVTELAEFSLIVEALS
jgi:membrane-bound serine protease (ClpP class)